MSFYDSWKFFKCQVVGGDRICFLPWIVAALSLWQVEDSINHTPVFWPYLCPVSQSSRPRGLLARNFLSWFVYLVILTFDLDMIISYKISKLENLARLMIFLFSRFFTELRLQFMAFILSSCCKGFTDASGKQSCNFKMSETDVGAQLPYQLWIIINNYH